MLDYKLLNNKGVFKSSAIDEEMRNLLDMTFQIPTQGFNYQVFEVSSDYIARPDLISYDAYGNTDYTDIICKLNGISNPFELNEGDIILLPSAEDLNSKSFVFKAPRAELENNDFINNTPKPKYKNEKRKPNEAIIGDSRFKIDPTSSIIIY